MLVCSISLELLLFLNCEVILFQLLVPDCADNQLATFVKHIGIFHESLLSLELRIDSVKSSTVSMRNLFTFLTYYFLSHWNLDFLVLNASLSSIQLARIHALRDRVIVIVLHEYMFKIRQG